MQTTTPLALTERRAATLHVATVSASELRLGDVIVIATGSLYRITQADRIDNGQVRLSAEGAHSQDGSTTSWSAFYADLYAVAARGWV